MKHHGADAMKRKRAEEDPRAEQIAAVFALPCIMFWSDGSQTDTTLAQAFTTEEDYNRYKQYKRSGKAYPVRVEAKELPEAELNQPSTIFPQGTRGEEYGLIKTMCQHFTEALEQFVAREGNTMTEKKVDPLQLADEASEAFTSQAEEASRAMQKRADGATKAMEADISPFWDNPEGYRKKSRNSVRAGGSLLTGGLTASKSYREEAAEYENRSK